MKIIAFSFIQKHANNYKHFGMKIILDTIWFNEFHDFYERQHNEVKSVQNKSPVFSWKVELLKERFTEIQNSVVCYVDREMVSDIRTSCCNKN